MSKTTIRIAAQKYEDRDDSLTAAAEAVATERGLETWQVSARWEMADDGRDILRETILVDVED